MTEYQRLRFQTRSPRCTCSCSNLVTTLHLLLLKPGHHAAPAPAQTWSPHCTCSCSNLVTTLHLLLNKPVTSASGERANSAPNFVKSDRCNRMGADRLKALPLFMHQDISVDTGEVVNIFVTPSVGGPNVGLGMKSTVVD